MKKLLVLCALILPITAVADDFGITVPEWKDFAPPAFTDVKAPKGFGKFNPTTKYWYQRRVNFEAELEVCKAKEANDERFNCYEQLKVEQYKENSAYNARLEAQMNPTMPGMESRADNMIPINGYINGMTKFLPNEFR